MENKDLQNEIVNAAAEKAAAATNEALETKTNELSESFNTKTEELAAETIKLAKSIEEVKDMATKNFSIGHAKRSPMQEMFAEMANGVSNLKKGQVFEINTKDFVANVSGGGTDNGNEYQIYREERVSDIKHDPNHWARLRNYIPTGQTSGGSVRYNFEDAQTDSSGSKAKGAAQTQSSVTLEPKNEPIVTLANVLTLPQEWLDDVDMINSYLSSRLIANLMDEEDGQILTATGSGNDMNGINSQGTTYTATTFETLFGGLADQFGTDANKYDALVATRAGMINNGFNPSVVILNPIDYASLLLIKSDQNEYVLQQTVTPEGSVKTFWAGLEVLQHQSQAADTFTMIDKASVQYWMNGGMTFSFGYNDTDFSSYEITARAIQRGAVTVYRADGCANGTFTNAEAALNA